MKRSVLASVFLFGILLGAAPPSVALAIEYYEEGLTFEGTGSFEIIVRDEGHFDGLLDAAGEPIDVEGVPIEIECEPTAPDGYTGPYLPSVHAVLSLHDAARISAMLDDAVSAAQAP
jgi:hypothetical protein